MPLHSSHSQMRRARELAAWKHAASSNKFIDLAVHIATAAERDWHAAPGTIARALRESRELGSAERWLLGEVLHGWLRHRRRLEWLVGEPNLRGMILLWLSENHDLVDAYDAKLAEMPAASATIQDISTIDDPVERAGIALSYPDWMVARIFADYGTVEGEKLLAAMNERAPLTVRVNRIRGTREELQERLAHLGIISTPTRLAKDGLLLETRRNVYDLTPFREGWMELQDEGSQLIAEMVTPPPGGKIIDACAGAGGKTLALASMLGNRGRITAFDISPRKLDELRLRARRAGVTNLQALLQEKEGAIEIDQVERVLVDAPCSGSGVIRRNPETKWRLTPQGIVDFAAVQLRILQRYAQLVCAGGRLIYATCSIFSEENEQVVKIFLQQHPEFCLVPLKEICGKSSALAMGNGLYLRLFPHVHGTDGFFAAVLQRAVVMPKAKG